MAQLYLDLLQRAVDPVGLSGNLAALRGGTALSTLWARVATSPEEAGLVQAAYQRILGRSAGPSEVSAWQGWLADGHRLDELEVAFVESAEGRGRIDALLAQRLGRAASAAERQVEALRLLAR